MQNFVPFSDSFERIADCLDDKRLGKQRVETYDCIGILTGFRGTTHSPAHAALLTRRYGRHPAVLMWVGHVPALRQYMRVICSEWVSRGFVQNLPVPRRSTAFTLPAWWGRRVVHRSHRCALLHKNWHHYRQYFDDYPVQSYVWPTWEV